MTAISLPELDKQAIDDLRERVSKLSDLDLGKLETPSLQRVGKNADQVIDRMLGRSKAPSWPWLATGIGLVVMVGALAAWFAFLRRPDWPRTGRGIGGRATADAIQAAENEGMSSHVPVETFRTDALTAVVRTNGTALEGA